MNENKKMNGTKTPDERLSSLFQKSNRRYTVQGIATMLGLHPTTVITGIGRLKKQGLNIVSEETTRKSSKLHGRIVTERTFQMKGAVGAAVAKDSESTMPEKGAAISTPISNSTFNLVNWRPTQPDEVSIAAKLAARNKISQDLAAAARNARVAYAHDGNFTIALVNVNDTLYAGASKFNPNDENNDPEIGEMIALCRAFKAGPAKL